MRLRDKLVGEIPPHYVTDLLQNQVSESRVLEYKAELPGNSAGDRKKFLASVSALANTAGGIIIFGVKEAKGPDGQNTGLPESIPGIPDLNAGSEELRLTSMMINGISPSIGGTAKFQALTLAGEKEQVLLLGIPQSFGGPHMVSFEQSNKFWRRSQSGKYPPGVTELRSMFNQPRSWRDEVEEFRMRRVGLILNDNATQVDKSSSVFIHVLPLGRLDEFRDLKRHETAMFTELHPLATSGGFQTRWNADGFLKSVSDHGKITAVSYTQWFRFGGIEAYSSRYVWADGANRIIDAAELVQAFDFFVRDATKALAALFDHEPPYAIVVSLIGARGATIGSEYLRGEPRPIDQDRIFFPPIVLESADDPIAFEAAVAPLKDAVYQCGGYSGVPQRRSNRLR